MRCIQRMMFTAVWVLALLTLSGCGDTARQSIKNGVYSYVGGSLSSGLISTQLSAYINDLFLQGFPGQR